MSDRPLGHVLRHLRRLAGRRAGAAGSDARLLERFAADHDEAAFAELVRRHGPLVLGVCRRVLGNHHDAEDAFQATFLVLARKAGSFRPDGSVGGWLYEVARRVAGRARADAARRCACERHAAHGSCAAADEEAARRELRPLLDEELARLPESCRLPLVLCYLQGKTHAEAARELGWPLGSMSKRLARGRELLRGRLARRGVTLAAAALATALAADATAAVPAALGQAALRLVLLAAAGEAAAAAAPGPVVALADGAVRQMFLARARWAVAVLLVVALVGTGVGVLAHQAPADAPPAAAKDDKPAPSAPAPTPLRADRYGDPLPAGAVARLGTVRLRHWQRVHGVAFSPDGKLLASAGWGEVIRLWDADTGKPAGELHDSLRNGTTAVAFSPDGKKLAAVGEVVRLWDLGTRRKLFEEKNQEGHVDFGVAFAPDGRSFATAGGAVRIWEVATGRKLRSPLMDGPDNHHCLGIAFSPDGKKLASGGGRTIRVWDFEHDSDPVEIASAHDAAVVSVAFAADGKTLVSGGYRHEDATKEFGLPISRTVGEVRLWDVATGTMLRELKADEPGEGGGSIAVSSDGKLLASMQRDRIRLWDLGAGKPLRDLAGFRSYFGSTPHVLAFSPDGRLLAVVVGDHAVRVWDIATGEPRLGFPQAHTSPVRSVAYSPDGRLVLTGGQDGAVLLWDVATAREVRGLRLGADNGNLNSVTFSPDGRTFAAGGNEYRVKDYVGWFRLWDVATGKELVAERLKPWVNTLAFAPDGKTLVVAKMDSESIALGPLQDSRIHLWDLAAGKERATLSVPGDLITCLHFSPDGKTFASAGEVGMVRVWDCPAGTQRSQFEPGRQKPWVSVAFSADGKTMAASEVNDESLTILDTATGRELHRIQVPGSKRTVVALSPDGRVLASGSKARPNVPDEHDRALHLWELATGREIARFQPGSTTAASLAFAPDGRSLVSGMCDGTALIWDVLPGGPAREPMGEELEQCWADLAGDDAGKAYAAIGVLVGGAGRSVAFLKERLPPSAAIEPARLRRLIADLDSDRFAVRDAAAKELERLGDQAAPALRRALEGEPSPEVRKRAEALLVGPYLVQSVEVVRRLRAMQTLEHIGSPEARQVLERLAKGDPAARETRAAQAALDRLARRPAAAP